MLHTLTHSCIVIDMRVFTSAEVMDIRKRYINKESAWIIAKRHKTSTQKIREVVVDIIAVEKDKTFLTNADVNPMIDDLKLKLFECKKVINQIDNMKSDIKMLISTMDSVLERLTVLERKVK
jgi:hypothetical protein